MLTHPEDTAYVKHEGAVSGRLLQGPREASDSLGGCACEGPEQGIVGIWSRHTAVRDFE